MVGVNANLHIFWWSAQFRLSLTRIRSGIRTSAPNHELHVAAGPQNVSEPSAERTGSSRPRESHPRALDPPIDSGDRSQPRSDAECQRHRQRHHGRCHASGDVSVHFVERPLRRRRGGWGSSRRTHDDSPYEPDYEQAGSRRSIHHDCGCPSPTLNHTGVNSA